MKKKTTKTSSQVYKKPVFEKEEKQDFKCIVNEHFNGAKFCVQCSGCHGCR